MKADKKEFLKHISYARGIREQIVNSSFFSKADFYCLKCGQMKPFGGDLAVQHYGNPGVTLFCNDCLAELEERLRFELDWEF
jgi:hypothetical protein